MRFRDADLIQAHAAGSYLKNLGNFFNIYLYKDYIYLKNRYTSVQFYLWAQIALPLYKKKTFSRTTPYTKKTLHYLTLNCI